MLASYSLTCDCSRSAALGANYEQSGGQGVQRPGVADLDVPPVKVFLQCKFDFPHYIGAGPPVRLVYGEYQSAGIVFLVVRDDTGKVTVDYDGLGVH